MPERGKLPPFDQPVIVFCEGFRCLGLLGTDGIWREAESHRELANVKGWRHVGASDDSEIHWTK